MLNCLEILSNSSLTAMWQLSNSWPNQFQNNLNLTWPSNTAGISLDSRLEYSKINHSYAKVSPFTWLLCWKLPIDTDSIHYICHFHQVWLKCPGLALLTLSWDKNWDSHSLVNGYPSFYPTIALVAPSPESVLMGQLHHSKACWELWLSDDQPHSDNNGQWQRALCILSVLQSSQPNPQRNEKNRKMYAIKQTAGFVRYTWASACRHQPGFLTNQPWPG